MNEWRSACCKSGGGVMAPMVGLTFVILLILAAAGICLWFTLLYEFLERKRSKDRLLG